MKMSAIVECKLFYRECKYSFYRKAIREDRALGEYNRDRHNDVQLYIHIIMIYDRKM